MKLRKIQQLLNRQMLHLNHEKIKMKKQQNSLRQQRTRTLIQLGGLVQKSGLMEVLNISPGDDLQDYDSLPKAAQVLGFLIESLEPQNIDIDEWEKAGERRLRYDSTLKA